MIIEAIKRIFSKSEQIPQTTETAVPVKTETKRKFYDNSHNNSLLGNDIQVIDFSEHSKEVESVHREMDKYLQDKKSEITGDPEYSKKDILDTYKGTDSY